MAKGRQAWVRAGGVKAAKPEVEEARGAQHDCSTGAAPGSARRGGAARQRARATYVRDLGAAEARHVHAQLHGRDARGGLSGHGGRGLVCTERCSLRGFVAVARELRGAGLVRRVLGLEGKAPLLLGWVAGSV